MKKRLLIALGLSLSVASFAASEYQAGSNGLDGRLFLDPHVGTLADQTEAVSINIGSQLPSTMHIVSTEDICKEIGLGAHFKTIAQKLEANAHVVVTAPASYVVVFTDDTCSDEAVTQHIDQVLAQIGTHTDPAIIRNSLSELKEVYRATFAQFEGGIALVTDEKQLYLGQPVWRKTPEGIEANVYHSEEEYLVSFANAGFTVEEIKRPCFYGELKYKMHKASLQEGEKGLGRAYIENHPFTIFYLVKK